MLTCQLFPDVIHIFQITRISIQTLRRIVVTGALEFTPVKWGLSPQTNKNKSINL